MEVNNIKGIINAFGQIILKSSTMPILQCINIETKGSKITFTGTNLNQTLIYTIDNVNNEPDGKMLIDFQEFKKLQEGISLSKEGNKIIAKHGRTKIILNNQNESLFPIVPDSPVKDAKRLELTDTIKQVIKTVSLATSKQEATIFSGVKISDEIVATDSKRIYAGGGFPLEQISEDGEKIEAVIPSRVVNFIEQFDHMFIGKREVVLMGENWELRSQLLQTKFPDHNKVFPKELPDWFVITDDVINVIKEAGKYIPKENFKITLSTKGDVLTVKTAVEDGAKFISEVKVNSSRDVEISFNQKLFLELAEIFNGEVLRAGDEKNPILINNSILRGLLMPLRTRR